MPSNIGILLVNLGTPDAPTAQALRAYLGEFLSDPRVIDLPRWQWLPILHGIVLRTRPKKSAAAYRTIWSPDGSPLLVIARRQARALQIRLKDSTDNNIHVEPAMRYGNPSLARGLERLRAAGCNRVLILPAFPQYSAVTAASTVDAIADVLRGWRVHPALRTVTNYHDEPAYIDALAASVTDYRAQHGAGDKLLISFHGIPQRYADAGDPYAQQCVQTARRLAATLELQDNQWQLAFQSRFGREPWLQPYTDKTLEQWGRDDVGRVDVICPGFSADCLETLEEIAIRNRALYLHSGGGDLRYIPALNDSPGHIDCLAHIAKRELGGWA